MDWPSYNRSLVRRGEILFSYDVLDTWDYELQRMNKNKMGKPFIFPNSFILAIGYVRYSFHLPYRQTEGIIKATGKSLPSKPSYGHICKRINKLNFDIKKRDKTDDDGICYKFEQILKQKRPELIITFFHNYVKRDAILFELGFICGLYGIFDTKDKLKFLYTDFDFNETTAYISDLLPSIIHHKFDDSSDFNKATMIIKKWIIIRSKELEKELR